VVIPVTQSGETADTLEATRIAKAQGARVLSLVNVVGSSITRISDGIVYLRAGLEIGVCSSKAYTAMMAAFGLLGAHLAEKRGTKTGAEIGSFLKEMGELPDKIRWCLEHDEAIVRCAEDARFRDAVSTFFLGRGYNFPSALEGALKLKEISYIHAEGYGAGEMKHGPIALVTDELPVICIATKSNVYEKVVSNMQEIRARNGILMSIATEGDEQISECCEQVIYVPECSDILSPIINAVPMQLFAYHVSVNRGCDVDQPRNLAKSVTVE
jgi:glucosamine--fructose-6-phosphate aminotransferase (isomerizing)